MQQNKKIAVTGATGLIGSEIQKYFHGKIIPFVDDITKPDEVYRFLYNLGDDVNELIHLAAIVPKQVVDEKVSFASNVNILGTIHILESLRSLKSMGRTVPWLFYASTSHCYNSSESPVDESSHAKPFTLYGLSKLHGEQWCEAFRRDYQLPICIGRIFSFSSPRQADYYFLPAMFKKIKNAPKSSVMQVPGVLGKRDFLRVEQICEVLCRIMELRLEGTFNIGSGHGYLLKDIIIKIANLLGREDIQFEFIDENPKSLVADTSKLKSHDIIIEDQLDILLQELHKKFSLT